MLLDEFGSTVDEVSNVSVLHVHHTPGAIGGAVSNNVVLASSVGALPHMSLFGSWWCWMLDMCLAV